MRRRGPSCVHSGPPRVLGCTQAAIEGPDATTGKRVCTQARLYHFSRRDVAGHPQAVDSQMRELCFAATMLEWGKYEHVCSSWPEG